MTGNVSTKDGRVHCAEGEGCLKARRCGHAAQRAQYMQPNTSTANATQKQTKTAVLALLHNTAFMAIARFH